MERKYILRKYIITILFSFWSFYFGPTALFWRKKNLVTPLISVPILEHGHPRDIQIHSNSTPKWKYKTLEGILEWVNRNWAVLSKKRMSPNGRKTLHQLTPPLIKVWKWGEEEQLWSVKVQFTLSIRMNFVGWSRQIHTKYMDLSPSRSA